MQELQVKSCTKKHLTTLQLQFRLFMTSTAKTHLMPTHNKEATSYT